MKFNLKYFLAASLVVGAALLRSGVPLAAIAGGIALAATVGFMSQAKAR